MDNPKNPTQKWLVLIVVIILLGGLVAFMMSRRESDDDFDDLPPVVMNETENTDPTPVVKTEPAPVTPVPTQTPDTTATPTTQKSVYKDGTYSAAGKYVSPEGAESVNVSMTLKDDVVVDVSVSADAKNSASRNWQKRFRSGIGSVVVGKKLDTLQISNVSGSSLTPIGFMDALAKIKVQAKA